MASSMANNAALCPPYSHARQGPRVGSSSIHSSFNGSQLSMFSLSLKRRPTNAPFLPKISAQSSPNYIPDANFYKVEAILRPWRIPKVSSALLKMGIRGVTVSDVKGFGAQGGLKERQAGSEFFEDKFVAKVKMEIVVSKDQVEAVIDKIIGEARTGEIGDGKIFSEKIVVIIGNTRNEMASTIKDVLPVSDVIRVRTGERGEKAEKMMGGRSDMSSVASIV